MGTMIKQHYIDAAVTPFYAIPNCLVFWDSAQWFDNTSSWLLCH